DEKILINYFNTHPDLKLIIAPHEIPREHLMQIESQLQRPSIRLSEAFSKDSSDKDCIIVDSFGLLSSLYRYGDIACIGGGFGKGIHNTLEAAVYGIPVIFGPKYHKFKEAKDLIGVGGGFSVSSEDDFNSRMNDFLSYHGLLEEAGKAAGNFVKDNAGATKKILEQLNLSKD
ncbi:MAG: 3-deoxy-D-manno-octulosonic acid transferase, partial [Tannerellaceae bacterium]|nr:3-deoxy-D-manno-octulosonic acid transferase [Tannerellaceae bacterium]